MPASGHILLYHRIAEPALDPHAICVPPGRFREHLRMLSDRCLLVPLSDLLRGLDGGDLPPGATALTFDDGYADNATTALPLLAELAVPATVFVATATLGTQIEFWWDRLQAVFLTPGTLPHRLSLRTGWRPFRADLGPDSTYDEETARAHAGWTTRSGPPPTRRHETYLRLFRRLQRLDGGSAERVLQRIEEWAGLAPAERTTNRSMSREQLEGLRDSGLIEFGAHTVHHPRLSKLRHAARSEEITASRATLAEIVGPVRHFAYPFGDDSGSADLVRAAGFVSACTTRPGPITHDTDRYRLPRIRVGDESADRLAMRLAHSRETT